MILEMLVYENRANTIQQDTHHVSNRIIAWPMHHPTQHHINEHIPHPPPFEGYNQTWISDRLVTVSPQSPVVHTSKDLS